MCCWASLWTKVLTAGSFPSFMVCTWSKAPSSPWISISFEINPHCWRRRRCVDFQIARLPPWCRSRKKWSALLPLHSSPSILAHCATLVVPLQRHTSVTFARSLALCQWWSRLTLWRQSTQRRPTICTSPTRVKSTMWTWPAVRSSAQTSRSLTSHLRFRSLWRWSSKLQRDPRMRASRASSFWAVALTGLEAAWNSTGAVCPVSELSGLWGIKPSSSTAILTLGFEKYLLDWILPSGELGNVLFISVCTKDLKLPGRSDPLNLPYLPRKLCRRTSTSRIACTSKNWATSVLWTFPSWRLHVGWSCPLVARRPTIWPWACTGGRSCNQTPNLSATAKHWMFGFRYRRIPT